MSKPNISKQDYALLHQLLSMREISLIKSLPRILEKYYEPEKIHATMDYIYVEGDVPVALVAHLDTVYTSPPHVIYHDAGKGVIWSPEGLGADDRAGVFCILRLLELGNRPSIVFTTGEETGGTGASIFVRDYPAPLVDTYFVIELDRCGIDDAVYYDCGNAAFEDFISSFGFVTNWGTFSDIVIIGPAWDIACVNLSVGYENEHSFVEYLNYRHTLATMYKVDDILVNYSDMKYDYQSDMQKWLSFFPDFPNETITKEHGNINVVR